jgi:Cu(I)/Ag(I) efflux system protein CusF
MKFAFVLSLLLAVSPIAFGQPDKGTVHKATGVVTRVDENKVSIKHEPIPSLNWPSMTMAFTVKDKSVMERMKKDQKVNFEFVQEGRDYVVTAVK